MKMLKLLLLHFVLSISIVLTIADASKTQIQTKGTSAFASSQKTRLKDVNSNADILHGAFDTKDGDGAMLRWLSSSVKSESALIDKETGRIYWEGGGRSTAVHASILTPMEEWIVAHASAMILSGLLLLIGISLLATFIRRNGTESFASSQDIGIVSSGDGGSRVLPTIVVWLQQTVWFVLNMTLLRMPEFDTWFILVVVLLYLLEAYACETRRYLSNAQPIASIPTSTAPELQPPTSNDDINAASVVPSPDASGVEEYIEGLRTARPIVSWKVRCFHYEDRRLWTFICRLWTIIFWIPFQIYNLIFQGKRRPSPSSDHVVDSSWFTRKKIITHAAQGSYIFGPCHDKTLVGVWKKALQEQEQQQSSSSLCTKISLSKLLILPTLKARSDYFQQQSDFIARHGHGRDIYAEFSTQILVPGFQPLLLAVRMDKKKKKNHHHLKRGRGRAFPFQCTIHFFWLCTLLGMTVPHRIWFDRQCDELRVTVAKETFPIPKQRPSLSSYFSTWPFRPSQSAVNTTTTTTNLESTNTTNTTNSMKVQQQSPFQHVTQQSGAAAKSESFRKAMQHLRLYHSENINAGKEQQEKSHEIKALDLSGKKEKDNDDNDTKGENSIT